MVKSFLDGLPPWAEETSKRYHTFNYGNLIAKIYSWFKRTAKKKTSLPFLASFYPKPLNSIWR